MKLLTSILLLCIIYNTHSKDLVLNEYSNIKGLSKINQFKFKIKSKKSEPKKLKKWLNDQLFLMAAEYDPNPTPYKGHITQEITCSNDLKPKEFFLKKMASFIGGIKYHTNDRYTQVHCKLSDAKNSSILLAIQCGEISYRLKVHLQGIKKHEKIVEFIKKIKCN